MLAGATAIVIVVAVAVGVSERDSFTTQSGEEDSAPLSKSSIEKPDSLEGTSGGAGRAAAPADPTLLQKDSGILPGQPRVQETSAALTLSSDADEVADVADGVVDVTDRYGGIVDQSNVSTGDQNPGANFSLRLPSQNLGAALADLSDLAHVKSRDEASLDITKPFVTAEERFDDARAEVDGLLEQLAEADSSSEIEAIRAQLRAARDQLAAARAQLKDLKNRAGFSVVTVGVVSEGDGPGWSLGDAADDAVEVLEAISGAILVSLAVIVPLGALGAALWFGTAGLRRRRRESVLNE